MPKTEKRLLDGEARHAIENDLDTTMLVEAAAGTGKTSSLVRRMVALLREGKTSVEHLATMTFTRKAAARLRETFQLALEEAHEREANDSNRRRLASALENMDRCFIGTIHSFCARILRERPLEAGVDPDFAELDEEEDRRLKLLSWETYTHRLFVSGSTVPREIEALGLNLRDLQTAYMLIADYADVAPVRAPISRPALGQVRQAVMRFLDRAARELPRTPPEKGWDALQSCLRRALRLRSVLDLNEDAEFVRLLEVLDRPVGVTKRRWPDGERAARLREALNGLRETTIRPALDRWREYLYPILLDIIRPAAEELQNRKLSLGQLGFQDLLIVARDLLCRQGSVRRFLQGRYTHLLVDEFQDTDPIQAEVLLYLTSPDGEERDWRKLHPRPGALFVVGDPKQSIYRFRRADIATYNRVRRSIVEAGGRVVELTTNFRSVAKICTWVNQVFDEIFPASGTKEQAAHVRLEAHRPSGDTGCGVFKLETTYRGPRRAELVAQEDAERIAGWIRWALDTGYPILNEGGGGKAFHRAAEPGDFLIITRNRLRLHHYAAALEARDVPYQISGGRAFGESEELVALVPFLQALVDPDDCVALVAFLRGELWGVDDNALYRFRRAGGRFSYLSPPPAGTDKRIVEAFDLLQEARVWARQLPPGAALGRICERLGIIAYGGARNLGDTRSGNVLKALTLAQRLSARGRSFAEVTERLAELLRERDVEGMTVEPGEAKAVQLMNLHRAKGLEAAVVFLADPNPCPGHPPLFAINREAEQPEGYFLIASQEGFQRRVLARPYGWNARAEEEKRFQEAEDDRLLYVAATRAKQMLVISVHPGKQRGRDQGGKEGPWAKLAQGPIRDLPEVESSMARQTPFGLENLPEEFKTFREEVRKRYAAVGQPGYEVTQVTKAEVVEGDSGLGGGDPERGVAWGRVLHRLLESLMRNDDLDVARQAEYLLLEEGLPLDRRHEVLRIVKGICASELWQRACRATRRFVEVPFALNVPHQDASTGEGHSGTLVKGVIDLVFWDEGEWTLVDYKSDRVDDNLSRLVARYAPQIEQYRRYWEELAGQRTKAALFFIDSAQVEWLD